MSEYKVWSWAHDLESNKTAITVEIRGKNYYALDKPEPEGDTAEIEHLLPVPHDIEDEFEHGNICCDVLRAYVHGDLRVLS